MRDDPINGCEGDYICDPYIDQNCLKKNFQKLLERYVFLLTKRLQEPLHKDFFVGVNDKGRGQLSVAVCSSKCDRM